ncbi:hypothetical protein SAMN05660971_04432 [Halomonas cupida]|uniref:Uncharacterized protein n=1 Tax=Halomonas cupida TaxID=44933 RepID=A0A1M7N399_9GAMM|nr:hypothetical protein SAMN05660971_04432 [Halomonas cupida]
MLQHENRPRLSIIPLGYMQPPFYLYRNEHPELTYSMGQPPSFLET